MFKIRNILLAIMSVFFFSTSINAIEDLDDVNKTMAGLKYLFEDHNAQYLTRLSDSQFIESEGFTSLSKHIEKNSLNLAYSQEECLVAFPVIEGNNKGSDLMIKFIRGDDRYWYIKNAFLEKGKRITYFPKHGFSPLALEFNFSDFIKVILSKKTGDFSGLVPFGRLNTDFFLKNKVSMRNDATLIIKNVVVYNKKNVKDVIYIKLKNFSKIRNNKRGWLIIDSGSMIEYYRSNKNKDIFIDYITKGSLDDYDLNRAGPYSWGNLRENLPTHSDEVSIPYQSEIVPTD